jgi:hypothetical protein
MIKFFYRLGAIRTHKRQKIFLWDSINVRHDALCCLNPFCSMSVSRGLSR